MNRNHRRAARTEKDPRLDGAEIRYGGRTVELRVYVNTDEAAPAVFERVRKAILSAPNEPMVVITMGLLPDKEATELWEIAIKTMRDQSEHDRQAAEAFQAAERVIK